jgi:hypothetical protein
MRNQRQIALCLTYRHSGRSLARPTSGREIASAQHQSHLLTRRSGRQGELHIIQRNAGVPAKHGRAVLVFAHEELAGGCDAYVDAAPAQSSAAIIIDRAGDTHPKAGPAGVDCALRLQTPQSYRNLEAATTIAHVVSQQEQIAVRSAYKAFGATISQAPVLQGFAQ